MPDRPAIKSVSVVRHGPTVPNPSADQSSPMSDCVCRWQASQEDVRSLPWSEVPDDMLVDFLRSAAAEVRSQYADNARHKALDVMAVCLSTARLPCRLATTWGATGDSLEMQVSLEPETPSRAPETTSEVDVPAGATEDTVRSALREAVESPPPDHRLVFDPEHSLPAQSLRTLVRQIEAVWDDPNSPDRQDDTLMVAASILIVWGHMSKVNAAHGDFVLAGVCSGDTDTAPGQQVRFAVQVTPNTDVAPTPVEDLTQERIGERARATVRMRPS